MIKYKYFPEIFLGNDHRHLGRSHNTKEILVEDTEAKRPQRRTNFLLRQVIVPSWVQVLLSIAWIIAVVRTFLDHPILALALAGASCLFFSYVAMPLRRRAGQAGEEENAAEVEAAPSDVKWSVIWRQMRTYQLWHITLWGVLAGGVLLQAVGLVQLP